MKKKTSYISKIVLMITIIYIILFTDLQEIKNYKYLLLAIIPFMLIHFFRIMRQYIIIMNGKVHMKNLTKAYLTSSLINTIMPFKLGEIFKIYLYGNIIDDYGRSIISVVLDKFFDAVFLLIAFILLEFQLESGLPLVAYILLFIVCVIFIIYISFEKTYRYLNEYLIIYKNNRIAIKCLKLLEKLYNLYQNIKDMIKHREILLWGLTLASWTAEISFVYVLKISINNDSNISSFIEYINGSFFGLQNELSNYYTIETVLLIIITLLLFGIAKICNRRGEKKV